MATPSWRRGLRQARARLSGRRVQEGKRHRPARGQARAPATQGGGREGQDRALQRRADRGQPALHHGRCLGAEASGGQALPRQAGGAGRGPRRPHSRPVPEGPQGCGSGRRRGRRDRAGGRHDPHAQGPGKGEAVLRQGPAQGRQPRRGRRGGRHHPGRRPAGRRQGRAAARRDAAVSRHRDPGRRLHAPHRSQHHHSHQEESDLLDRRGPPERPSPSACSRASARWRPTTSSWGSST